MPTINKLQRHRQATEPTETKKIRAKAYNNTAWRKLRDAYLKAHPICEKCWMEDGKVVPAEDVHHITTPFKNGIIDFDLLLDRNNLQSLCKDCHGKIHGGNMEREQEQREKLKSFMNALQEIFEDKEDDEDISIIVTTHNSNDNRNIPTAKL